MKQYEKVLLHIDALSLSKAIHTGSKLPSIRALCSELGVSKATVIKAYDLLVASHKAYVIPKSGYYWLQSTPAPPTEASHIDFTKLHPDPAMLPYKEFEHCLVQAIDLYKKELFNYGDVHGLPQLRHALVSHLAARHVHCREEQIILTSGSQQALSLLSEMPMDTLDDGILIEQPSYSVFQSLTALKNMPMTGISRNENGIDFKSLEQHFKSRKFKCFYTIPRCHNPLGVSLSEKDKQKLVRLAQKYGVYLIEDDYLADLTTDLKSLPLHYYDTADRVIYVKSFSKAFLPGIRLGAVILPKSLADTFSKHKKAHDLNTAVLSQGALELYLSSGLYDKHTKKARKWYDKKRLTALSVLSQINTPKVKVILPETGFLSYLEFSQDYPFESLLEKIDKHHLKVTSEDSFYLSTTPHLKGIRLCYSALSEEEIKTGLAELVQLLNTFDQSSADFNGL